LASAGTSLTGTTASLHSVMQNMLAHRGRARQFWQVFDNSPVPMTTVDNERRHLAANPAARLLFRMSLTELLARRIDDLTRPEQLKLLSELWATLLTDGAVAGPYDVDFPNGDELAVVFCALANALPGQHLIVFAPADWPEDELIEVRGDERARRAPGGLSRREREVLSLIAAGADQAQIAAELTIAVPTVRTHVRNVLRKLGARNRAHAIALAMHDGVIELRASPEI
jgi:DNA-binding CsgD family transcriptional regulator